MAKSPAASVGMKKSPLSKSGVVTVSVSTTPAKVALPSTNTPAPSANLRLNLKIVNPGQIYHRIHSFKFSSTQFNPGYGNARFSPIKNASGKSIPTMYGGESLECAAMESVFHDIPYGNKIKIFQKAKLDHQMYSAIQTSADLVLVDLTSISLRNMGIQRNQLIDTEAYQYPETRLWAEAIHTQCPAAQGMQWVSRQHDTELAVILFGDRIPKKTLHEMLPPIAVVDPPVFDKIKKLASIIGVKISA